MVVVEYLLLLVVVMVCEKKYFNLKMLSGVVMNLLLVMCDIVDLCSLILLVILCRFRGFMVSGLYLRKWCWWLMIVWEMLSIVVKCCLILFIV